MTLGVIILNWNGLKLLKEFLPTAAKYTHGEGVELVVADNGSTDGSAEWIKCNFPEVKVMEFTENLGFAGGYNKAISESDYDYVVLLNSDVEVTDGWWQPLLAYMQSHQEAGALQPKIRSYHHREYFEYAGAAGGLLDRLGYPYCRGRVLGKIEKDEGQYDGLPAEVTWASGAALMVRVSAYIEVGGLDERFFAHMEEIDLCCRMIAAGYKVMALSDSVVFHVGGASLEQGNPKKTYLNFRNNLLLLYKNLPTKRGRRLIFIRRLADTMAWGMFVAKGDWKNARAVLKAHSDYRKMKKYYRPAAADKLPLSKKIIMLSYLGC